MDARCRPDRPKALNVVRWRQRWFNVRSEAYRDGRFGRETAATLGRVLAAVALAFSAAACVNDRTADAVGAGGDPWAVGYAVQVARVCPEWQVETQQTLAARGLLPQPLAGAALIGFDGPFQRDCYRGQTDADADRSGQKDFCGRLRVVAGPKWARLARVFRRE
jgi:hypothetical protein